jgi:HEAT repeat protein
VGHFEDPRAIEPLAEYLHQVISDYWDTRLNAVWLLGEYGQESARPALEVAREDPNEDVRARAKEALAKLER